MSERLSTSPYKGSRDFYPAEMRVRRRIFAKVRQVLESYGFEEYDGPMLEPFELYAAKTGEEIVNQQLYWMVDRGERKVAIRPEMTPTLARMVAAKVQELPKPVRWYAIPNLWRYERPQRGRLREHWQINADLLGGEREKSDSELISLASSLFSAFGGEKHVEIHFNSRRLMDQLFLDRFKLQPAQATALSKTIDAKGKLPEADFDAKVREHLSDKDASFLRKFFEMKVEDMESQLSGEPVQEIKAFLRSLQEREIQTPVIFDPAIMRGLDYYTGIVFEAFDVSPENRRALFGGGRYDNLIGLFSKNELSGVGFGLGDVTLVNFLETHNLLPAAVGTPRVYVGCTDEKVLGEAFKLESRLRRSELQVLSGQSGDQLKNHLKAASKLEANFFVGLLENEWKQGKVIVKNLQSGEQTEVSVAGHALEDWAHKINP